MTSLTLKPQLLRADTIDLQSHDNPSAKDHSRGQYHAGYSHAAGNHPGSHHAQALRNANHEAYQEQNTSPRIGGFDHGPLGPQGQEHIYDEGDDDEDDHSHTGLNGTSHDNGYDDGDGIDSQDEDMDDELLDKISSSPSIEDEDIDFEFVYALHTFVATVEGQANATKGDTMVLLDDSNSYWWLVRVVKDGSIGYLPAEHIETPTERLARLNKHRNIDLSAAMLGDNPEKPKNPLKKAMRRRNAKTVNFAPPTYYEPDEQQWSDEEDGDEVEDGQVSHVETSTGESEQEAQQTQQTQQIQQGQQQQSQQIRQTIEPQNVQPLAATIHRVEATKEISEDEPTSPVKADVQAPAPLQTGSQDNLQRSRRGVVRNTDSFFKDDTVETKKISLTPRLLRGDSDVAGPNEQDVKQSPSLDTFDKVVGEDKSKDGKKKEKKGMLSGLFKRKDKSAKGSKSDIDEPDQISEEPGRSPQPKDSMDSETTPERKPSKLQKAPPHSISTKTSPTETRSLQRDNIAAVSQQSMMASAQPTHNEAVEVPAPQSHAPESQQPSRFPSLQEKRSVFAPITGALRSKNSSQDMGDPTIKPVYSKRAKERFAIDDSESEDDSTPTAQSSVLRHSISPVETNDSIDPPNSAVRVSPLELSDSTKATQFDARTPLSTETKPGGQNSMNQTISHIDTPTSPSDQTASTSKQSPSIPTHTPSTSRSTPTWSDASLRNYMDSDQDIRDLLVIVHDKTNITPVGPEHSFMNGLFASERTKLADMQSQLDTMLLSWLSKKNTNTAVKV